MRLAIVTHNVIRGDGQGRVNYEIARYALRQGVKVWLLADRVDDELQQLGATWVPVKPFRQPLDLLKVWEFTRLANRVLNRMGKHFDVIQAFGYVLNGPHHVNTAQYVHHACRRSANHAAGSRRDLHRAYHSLYCALNAGWERRAFRKAQAIVACSQRVGRELSAMGVPPERTRVILNGVDCDEFCPGGADREALGLPIGVPLALFVGELRTPRKNLDTLLRALLHVPSLHIAVVGATQGSPYPRLASRLGLGSRVQFLGFRRDVPQLMRAADVCVCPSRYEPFSLVVLEAMASGVPVITTGNVGAAELVTPDCGVVLGDPNDAQALAAALEALAHDPARRASLGQAARTVAEQHSWGQMAASYLSTYSEFVSSGRT
jgi:glycosyltransferase involved in cell wall biosynthesis